MHANTKRKRAHPTSHRGRHLGGVRGFGPTSPPIFNRSYSTSRRSRRDNAQVVVRVHRGPPPRLDSLQPHDAELVVASTFRGCSAVIEALGPNHMGMVAKVGVARVWRAGGRAIFVALIAGSLMAAACGGSSTANSKSPGLATPNPSTSASPPPGGPVPAQLQGDWFYHRADGWVQLTLNGEQYGLRGIQNPHFGAPAAGSVVINGDEIDFFNGDQCGIPLPGGIGRYRWTVTGGVLALSPLNADPCGRSEDLADTQYQRTIT
jgi:hypothetical protein